MAKVSQHFHAAVCENFIVKMDRNLHSRSASTARDKNAASVTPNTASQESVSGNEPERNIRNVERDNQNAVELSTNSNVTSGSIKAQFRLISCVTCLPHSWQTCRQRTQNWLLT
jgi:hypothetical protein